MPSKKRKSPLRRDTNIKGGFTARSGARVAQAVDKSYFTGYDTKVGATKTTNTKKKKYKKK